MYDPVLEALSDLVSAVSDRGVIATPISGGLLLKLAPARERASEPFARIDDSADFEWVDDGGGQTSQIRNGW